MKTLILSITNLSIVIAGITCFIVSFFTDPDTQLYLALNVIGWIGIGAAIGTFLTVGIVYFFTQEK